MCIRDRAKGFIKIYGLTAKLAAARDVRFGNGVDLGTPDAWAARSAEPVGRTVRGWAGRRAGRAVGEHPLRLAAGSARPGRVAGARPGAARRGPAGRR